MGCPAGYPKRRPLEATPPLAASNQGRVRDRPCFPEGFLSPRGGLAE